MNCISEPAMGHQLPKGLKLIPGYSPLSPHSYRVSAVVENGTDSDVTIPARTTIGQLGLANRIPKLIYPGDDYDNDHDPEEMDDVVLLHCGCLSLNPFIEISIRNNSSSSDVLNIQASISISPKFESK